MSYLKLIRQSFFWAIIFQSTISSASSPQTDSLASGVQDLIFAEQNLLSRDLNKSRLTNPKNNFQEDQYKPENKQVFQVRSYWVDKDSLKFFKSAFISDRIQKLFERTDNGKEQVLMLVHPESESMFRDLVAQNEPGPLFWATATSSSRTLVMWSDTHPELAFFGKLSLNAEIGGSLRTISQGEVASSLGINEVLFTNQRSLPSSFSFLPETLSLIPKDFERGGMIIREIPEDMASGKKKFVPLFSLYADRGEQMPLLAEMIRQSKMHPKEFILERIIRPFVQQWMDMVLTHGIAMEPHAQNVLIGLDSQGLVNGTFRHRDFGGFNADLAQFRSLNMTIPKVLPVATTLENDYHQHSVSLTINAGLETYFDQGFVFNLDQKLPEWVKKGWIPEYREWEIFGFRRDVRPFSNMIYETMAKDFARRTQGQFRPTAMGLRGRNTHEWIIQARKYLTPPTRISCEKAFN